MLRVYPESWFLGRQPPPAFVVAPGFLLANGSELTASEAEAVATMLTPADG